MLHIDDTSVKILELMGEIRSKTRPPKTTAIKVPAYSGVVALDGQRIALFFSGPQHAGENFADVPQRRAAVLPPPVQMCDAISRNLPEELKTIVADCLARRQFVDVYDRFPEACRHLLETLAVMYLTDAISKQKAFLPEVRLA